MNVTAFLDHLVSLPWYRDQIVHQEDIPPRLPTFRDLERPLNPDLQRALESTGIRSLYAHQAEAIDAARRGENVVVATPAASGKSLCYHLPVLDRLLEDRSGRALLLFPTKALTQDQARSIDALVPQGSRLRHDIFDGDTPSRDRSDIRRNARIILSNPNMLHVGILPNHRS